MARFVREQSWPIPYLHDESQDVARALGAQSAHHTSTCSTANTGCRYRGAPDADHETAAAWLHGALDAVLAAPS